MEKIPTICTLEPYVSQKIWGYEKWLLSTLTGKESAATVNGTPLSVRALTGDEYPLLIKLIQANDTLSVQVHPDDEYSTAHEDSKGKTECWYVLSAEPNATLITGVKDNYNRQTFAEAIASNTLEGHLYRTAVQQGDFLFIPAGTVHAIFGGLRILEIQQPSDVTYRLYDWGRGRELHIQKSLDVIKNVASKPIRAFSGAFSCDYFTVEKIDIEGVYTAFPRGEATATAYFVLNGSGTFANGLDTVTAQTESLVLVQPCEPLTISGNLSVMKIQP